jgi:hypothetical protein
MCVLLVTLRLGAPFAACLRAGLEGVFVAGCWVFCRFIVILQLARIEMLAALAFGLTPRI